MRLGRILTGFKALHKDEIGGMDMAKAEYLDRGMVGHILACLTDGNRLACEISLATGLRIGDVLALPTGKFARRMTVKEQKTGKRRQVTIPAALYEQARAQAGRYYVFEGRLRADRPRTRQAVYSDLVRAARAFRVEVHLVPHSLRKVYAVEAYRRSGGDLEKVKRLLNHDSEAVTMIYAMADMVAQNRKKR